MNELKSLINLPNNKTIKMIYQASKDGFDKFHSKCDGYLRTLTVIKAVNSSNIFGGYTEADWTSSSWKSDPNAFLFSLVNAYNTSVKLNVVSPSYSIFAYSTYLPTFGSGHDLTCGNTGSCYSNLGNAYQLPSSFTAGSTAAQSYLAGSYSFIAYEVEVYDVYIERKFFLIYLAD